MLCSGKRGKARELACCIWRAPFRLSTIQLGVIIPTYVCMLPISTSVSELGDESRSTFQLWLPCGWLKDNPNFRAHFICSHFLLTNWRVRIDITEYGDPREAKKSLQLSRDQQPLLQTISNFIQYRWKQLKIHHSVGRDWWRIFVGNFQSLRLFWGKCQVWANDNYLWHRCSNNMMHVQQRSVKPRFASTYQSVFNNLP